MGKLPTRPASLLDRRTTPSTVKIWPRVHLLPHALELCPPSTAPFNHHHLTMSNDYKPVPTSSPSSSPRSSTDDQPHRPLRASIQAEFERPPPSWWKRAALVAGLMFMLWLCHRLGGMGWGEQPKVIYASRFVFLNLSTSHFFALLPRAISQDRRSFEHESDTGDGADTLTNSDTAPPPPP
jgi:hypothetical protein